MPSTYTLNNGIELIGTGEQSGTWGDTTNTNLGLLDAALDGQVTITLGAAGSSGSPNALPITDGTASNGRNRMVVFADGGDLGATAYVQLTPNDAEKIIYIRNSLSGSRSVILFQGTYNASNDYEVPAGTTAVVYFDGAGAGAVAANVFNNAYFDGLRLGSVSVTAILDEDNMASDSATALATQQSIKAYVDSQVGTVDTLAEILAIGNTTGATDIAVDSAQKVQFRDAAIYINSSVDGQLDIVADTEIQIAATTVDLNGALDVSGTALVTGVLTTTAATVSNGGGQFNGAINVGVDDTGYDVKFFGATTGKSLLWDESADSLIVTGTTTLVGTTNLDAVDIDGATQIDATVTVGVDDTGYDVKFFGATAGAYMLWDESADDLILGGAAGLSVNSTALVTGVLTTTAATVHTGGITMPDNAKAIFGTGSDLEIYHDGSSSILADVGTGRLEIHSNGTGVTIQKGATEYMAQFNVDGAVQLYYDDAEKLATTATGIDVTGTVTATGTSVFASLDISGDIDVDGTTNLDVVDIDGAVDMASTLKVGSTITINDPVQTTYGLVSKVKSVYLSSTDATYANLTIRKEAATSTDYLQFRDSGNALLARLTYLGGLTTYPAAGGHAVFNEDGADADFRVESATTANAFFVEGSSGNVGIGTSSPASDTANERILQVNAPTTYATLSLSTSRESVAGNNIGKISFDVLNNTATYRSRAQIITESAGSTANKYGANMMFFTASDNTTDALERMRIDSSGGLITNPAAGGHAVFNEGGIDADFRVESDAGPYAFYMDAGANSGYGRTKITSNAVATDTSVAGGTSDTYINGLTIENNEATYTNGGLALVNKYSWGYGSAIKWYNIYDQVGVDGTLGETNSIHSQYVSANNMDTVFSSMISGALTETLSIGANGTVVNDGAIDNDFRVESDTYDHALFVDAGNNHVIFGTSAATTTSFYFDLNAGVDRYAYFANDSSTAGNPIMFLNRQTSDGDFIHFRQANSIEGSISVSGSTVSYNGFSGRHESSGIPVNTPVGTVVSTINALDVYPATQADPEGGVMPSPKAGQTRADHAQVEVSTSEGDACVYGVVSEFDSNGKLIVTSVGIGSIRVTGACSKGDLLESNGDGTAKVQSDDIIRSKTIGKVTIGNSDTGVKLVSCVMYCG
jgi:hypothetical protein